MAEREQWGSRIGFILAAVGSAVGLGNIWRFPYVAADSGGAAFLVVYLAAAVIIGFPAMLAEFVIGRRSQVNIIDSFREIGYPWARFIGVLGFATGFVILSYYSVVGGWVFRYVIGSATGAYFGDPAAYFGTIAAGTDAVLFHALFMGVTVGIVALGIKQGIEAATKLMVPSIVVLMVALAIWGATLAGAGEGYAYFLSPDFSALFGNIWSVLPAAVGQAFFSLSLGMGAMITYSSYLGDDDNLGADGITITVLNTFIGVLAGLVVFPLLFAEGISVGEPGPGAIFVSVASAFGTLPLGNVFGAFFFGVVAIAALSSAISLLEVVVSYIVDNYDVGRPVVASVIGLLIFLLGVPTALDTATLNVYDVFANTIMLPLGVLLIVLFVGWIFGPKAVDELRLGTDGVGRLPDIWLWHIRTVVLLAVLVTVALAINDFAAEFLGGPLF